MVRASTSLTRLTLEITFRFKTKFSRNHEGRKTETLVGVKPFNQYLVKMDGSHRVTLHNRRLLKKCEPMFQAAQMEKITEGVHITAKFDLQKQFKHSDNFMRDKVMQLQFW